MSSVLRPDIFIGKVAIVTGGATGIGRAITFELATLGCAVVIASRTQSSLQTASNELNQLISSFRPTENVTPVGKLSSHRVAFTVCNIRQPASTRELVAFVLEQAGRVDFLINNAGGQFLAPLTSISDKGWNAVIDTNLNGTRSLMQAAYDSAFLPQRSGVIVNITANYFTGFPLMAHTGAARAAVGNLVQSAAVEWAPDGVRVVGVAPGVIFSSTAADNYVKSSAPVTEVDALPEGHPFRLAVPSIPAARLGTVEEVSALVAFLCTPAAAYITGTTVRVDGGQGLSGWALPAFPPAEVNAEEERRRRALYGPQSVAPFRWHRAHL